MLIGYFTEYRGYKWTIEYDYDDGIYFGSLVGIEDSISYHAKSVFELLDRFHYETDLYVDYGIKFKGELNG